MSKAKLGKLTELISGFAFDSSLFNSEGIGMPLIRVRDVNSGFAGVYFSGEFEEKYVVRDGDLLIGMDGDFKCIEWQYGNALLNQRVCKIVPNNEFISHEYLRHFLPGSLKDINRVTNYTTVKHLSSKAIADIEIPLPPLPTQRHIASLLSKAEHLIAQRKESIRLLDEYVKAVFAEMFGDLDKNEKGFEIIELEKFCSDIVDCPHTTPVKTDRITEYPCIRTSELQNGYIKWESMQYIDEKEYMKRTKRLRPKKGDIIYAREGTFGDAVILPNTHNFSLGQRTMLFRPLQNRTNSIFLWAMVRSEYVLRQAKKMNSGSTVGHVNVKDIRKFKVLNPPYHLQAHFAHVVEKVETLKAQNQQSLRNFENLYGSLSKRAFDSNYGIKHIA